jgi:hypothetical protein
MIHSIAAQRGPESHVGHGGGSQWWLRLRGSRPVTHWVDELTKFSGSGDCCDRNDHDGDEREQQCHVDPLSADYIEWTATSRSHHKHDELCRTDALADALADAAAALVRFEPFFGMFKVVQRLQLATFASCPCAFNEVEGVPNVGAPHGITSSILAHQTRALKPFNEVP